MKCVKYRLLVHVKKHDNVFDITKTLVFHSLMYEKLKCHVTIVHHRRYLTTMYWC